MTLRFIEFLNSTGDRFSELALAGSTQVALLVAALYVIDRCIRQRARAVVRYAIWLLVLVKLVLPVSLRTPLSAGYWLAPEQDGWHALSEVRTKGVANESVRSSSEVDGRGASGDARNALPPSGSATRPDLLLNERQPAPVDGNELPARAGSPLDAPRFPPRPAVDPTAAINPAPAPSPPPRLRTAAWIFCGWALCVAVLAGLFVQRSLGVRRTVAVGCEPPDELREQLADCCAALSVRTPVGLKLVHPLHSPAICGLLRPTILLPASLAGTLAREPMRMVFVHELTHWKRGDLHVQFVQGVLQILYFFHPAVWLANAMLRKLREQAVDETVLVLAPNRHAYGETLIDISTGYAFAPELSLGLLGVVESRRALTERIRRIVERPIPKSARLGALGLIAVVLLGLTLIPMAGRSRAAQAPSDAPRAKEPASKQAPIEVSPVRADKKDTADAPMLSGRILDERGEPVTDANVQLNPARGGRAIEARADEQGRYRFDPGIAAGEYRVSVRSQRCVSLQRWDKSPIINLTGGAAMVRDITLQRGCRIRVRTVDEQDKPISGVSLFVASATEEHANAEGVSTDRQGWVTIPALPVSKTEYVIGAMHDKFGFGRLTVTLSDPEAVPEHTLTLAVGKEITGTAICSDGHPPVGWRVNALPTWWNFGTSPMGEKIAEDGSFTLRHIVPGDYKVAISIPVGPQTSTTQTLLPSENLSERAAPLALKVDYPSPASMSPLEIKVTFADGLPKQGFWVFADSIDGRFHGSQVLNPNDDKVVIGPIPNGEYRVSFESTEIEPLVLKSVELPVKDLAVKITVTGPPSLRGRVVAAAANLPVDTFRIRVEKKKTLRGPTYQESPTPREFKDPQGQFDVSVAGPGVYVLHVLADGFAPAQSEELNTDTDKGREIVLKLNKPGAVAASGPALSGMVVDSKQEPIDGATVRSLARAFEQVANGSPSKTDAWVVKTVKGDFRLVDLKAGKDLLEVKHPDYAPTYFETDVAPDTGPLTIVLKVGSTVRGHVYDPQGRPQAGVGMSVKHTYSIRSDGQPEPAAVTVTDRNGFYEFAHLPEDECTVARVKEWDSAGVVMQTIRTQEQPTITLDFGGKSEVTGQLIVNGAPLGNAEVVFSDNTPGFGTLRATSRTEADGSFVFRGLPPGRRALDYYVSNQRRQTVRVGRFAILPEGNALGKLEVRTGSVSVHLVKPMGLETGDVRLSLGPYSPRWLEFYGGIQQVVVSPAGSDKPFVMQHVPVGRYEIAATYDEGKRGRMQEVEITPDKLDQTVSIVLTQGSGVVRARIDPAKLDPNDPQWVMIRSRDNRFQGRSTKLPGGWQEIQGLPPGDYYLTRKSLREPFVLAEFTLGAGETKELDVTEAVIREEAQQTAALRIYAFTPEGVALTGCDMQLTRGSETLLPLEGHQDLALFTGPPGAYELTASYPGFEGVKQTAELRPPSKDRHLRNESYRSLRIVLRPK